MLLCHVSPLVVRQIHQTYISSEESKWWEKKICRCGSGSRCGEPLRKLNKWGRDWALLGTEKGEWVGYRDATYVKTKSTSTVRLPSQTHPTKKTPIVYTLLFENTRMNNRMHKATSIDHLFCPSVCLSVCPVVISWLGYYPCWEHLFKTYLRNSNSEIRKGKSKRKKNTWTRNKKLNTENFPVCRWQCKPPCSMVRKKPPPPTPL